MKSFLPALLITSCLVGCTGSSGTSSSETEPFAAASTTPDQTAEDGIEESTNGVIAKVSVMADGSVLLNNESIAIGELGSELDALENIKEIWYHRESPESHTPHENALKAIGVIANRRLPIAMFLDAEFTRRASFGE